MDSGDINNIKIIVGIISVGLFQFFSLKFSYWKLKDSFESIKNNIKLIRSDIESVKRSWEDHEERLSELERKFGNMSEEELKNISHRLSEFTGKERIFLKLLAEKNKQMERDQK